MENDKTNSSRKNSQIIWFLALFSGASRETLRKCPSGSVNQRAALGAVLLFAVTFTAVGFFFASQIAFRLEAAVLAGLMMWGFLYAFERSLIVSLDMDRKRKWHTKFLVIAWRVLFLISISGVSSTAVLMEIYETEITAQIQKQGEELNQETRSETAFQLDSLNIVERGLSQELLVATQTFKGEREKKEAEVSKLTRRIQNREDKLVMEIEGNLTRGAGNGPAAQAKREQIEEDKIRLEELKAELNEMGTSGPAYKALLDTEEFITNQRASITEEREKIKEREEDALAHNDQVTTYGFQDRYLALMEIKNDGGSVRFMYLLWGLFVAIELVVVLLKGLQPRISIYEECLHLDLEREMEIFNVAHKRELLDVREGSRSNIQQLQDLDNQLHQLNIENQRTAEENELTLLRNSLTHQHKMDKLRIGIAAEEIAEYKDAVTQYEAAAKYLQGFMDNDLMKPIASFLLRHMETRFRRS